jgi:hypothetical protein
VIELNPSRPNHQTPNAIEICLALLLLLAQCLFGCLATLSYPLQNALSVLVELEFCDDDFGGCDAEGLGLAVGLLADDTLDVDDVWVAVSLCSSANSAEAIPLTFQPVHRCDLALTSLV